MFTLTLFITTFLSVTDVVISNINSITLETISSKRDIADYTLVSKKGTENSSDMRELYLKVPLSDEELEEMLSLLRPDGSWTDIDYSDRKRSGWEPMKHALRLHRLSIRYAKTGDETILDAIHRAMAWWFDTEPVCTNWWYNEIGIPREMGPAFLLLKDRMTPGELSGAVKVMDKSTLSMTGQNKVWLAGNVLIKGLLLDDEALVRQARDSIVSEIFISDSVEGLQKDFSFHQHGPQLQFGNYGLSFACTLCWWIRALEGSGIDVPEQQIEILRDFIREGLTRVVWKGMFDFSACARQVFPDTQRGKAICAMQAAANLGFTEKELVRHQLWGRYYTDSDFGVYRTRKWYSSIRMQSSRTIGFETTNSENMKGYFSSDGALLVRKRGDEYDNISPVLDWKKVPGTTAYDDLVPLWGCREKFPYNKSAKVFGQASGKLMACAMDYDRDSLRARKAWFFWKDGIVCLGAGISRPGSAVVTTSVQQCHLRGRVRYSGRGDVRHDGISYFPLEGTAFRTGKVSHSGSWHAMAPYLSDEEVKADLFELFISHGEAPQDASYAYVVVPGKKTRFGAARAAGKVEILENSTLRQTVRIGRDIISIDWNDELVSFSKD